MMRANCALCEKKFSANFSLYRHLQSVHNVKPLIPRRAASWDINYVNCDMCHLKFSNKKCLLKHKRTKHNYVDIDTSHSNILCMCGDRFAGYKIFRKHLEEKHQLISEKTEFSCQSLSEFHMWKESMEKDTCTQYVKTTGVKIQSGNRKKTYFQCHRSGTFMSKSTGKNKSKRQGTNKIGKTCPSTIEMIETDGRINIVFWKTHCNHSRDLNRLTLTDSERSHLAGKLAEGITLDKILDDIRDEFDDKKDCISLVTKQHLRNIRRDFKLLNSKQIKNDTTSADLWVKSMHGLNRTLNPVLFYKPRGVELVEDLDHFLLKDDFFLIIMTSFQRKAIEYFKGQTDCICIDSIHATSAYNFELTTLLVTDELGRALPFAFCISNRTDEIAWKILFMKIRDDVGNISTDIFMSDDNTAYYNAWESIMGATKHRLSCPWYIDENWRKLAREKISGPNAKIVTTSVYKALRTMLQETNENEDEFDKVLMLLVEELIENDQTREFGQHFEQHCAPQAHMWAYCFRKKAGMNTTSYLESTHKALKHFYLEGKKIKRLDSCISALIRFTRITLTCVFEIKPPKDEREMNTINNSHFRSHLYTDLISEVEKGSLWKVTCSVNAENCYIVEKVAFSICENECLYRCTYCAVCIHMYICSCVDNLIKNNICEHIHACIQDCTGQEHPSNDGISDEEDLPVVTNLLPSVPSHSKILLNTTDSVELLQQRTNKFLECILTAQFSAQDISTMDEKMSSLLDFAIEAKRIPQFEDRGRLQEESEDLHSPSIYIHSEFDHKYCSRSGS